MLNLIRERNPDTYIEVFTSCGEDDHKALADLRALVDEVTVAENFNFSLRQYLNRRSSNVSQFDVVDFQFAQPIEVVRTYRHVGKKILFTPMESLVRCELIDRGLEVDEHHTLTSRKSLQEIEIANFVDQTVCVSKEDSKALSAYTSGYVTHIETGISETELGPEVDLALSKNKSFEVTYLAFFGSGTNRAALKWYLDWVHPRVQEAVPAYILSIVGRGDVTDILRPMPDNVSYVGEVDHIAAALKTASVGIAPALSGSGFRGKINQYAHLGLPSVASPIACEGLKYENGVSIFSAEDPNEFAVHIITLLTQDDVRQEMIRQARLVCHQHHSWSSKWPAIKQVYGLSS